MIYQPPTNDDHVMIDIETMGQEAGCAILSITAVQFNIETGQTLSSFHKYISLNTCIEKGLKIEPETALWWMKQDKKSLEKFTQVNVTYPIETVLREFAQWFSELNNDRYQYYNDNVYVWARGPRFDLAILSAAYKACGFRRTPWDFRKEMCVRTMEFLHPSIKEGIPFTGTLHDGPSDCFHQIKYVSKIYKEILDERNNAIYL